MDERMMAVFKQDRYAEMAGIDLVEVSKGYAKTQLEVGEHHLNFVKSVQGGLIFTLADYAFAVASNSHGTIAVAINANISFFKPVSSGKLVAEAREISFHHKLAGYNVDVTDEEGDLVANFKGQVYRKKDPLVS